MNVSEIVSFLNDWGYEYDTSGLSQIDNEHDLQFRSIRTANVAGIYYFKGDNVPEVPEGSVLIVDQLQANEENIAQILVGNPQLAHYKLSASEKPNIQASIHETAIIHADAIIGKDVTIGAYSIIGNSVLSDNVIIRNNCTIEDNVQIGQGTTIDSNSVIGAEGLAWIWDEDGTRINQPQTGGVTIGQDCYLGTDVTVVRGSLHENTQIGKETLIAHGTKIGHGSKIGDFVHMANNVSLAGSAVIQNRAFLGSGSVVSSHVEISIGTIVGAGAVVTKKFNESSLILAGVPAKVIGNKNFEKKPKGTPKPHK